MRYELYSLACKACGGRNAPTLKRCAGCGGELTYFRRCSRCQEENPPNAYVCLKCYAILQQKPTVGFLHWHVPWSVSAIVLVVLTGWTGMSLFKGWFEYAEAQIETNAVLARQLDMQQREWQARRDE